jgi:succinate-acetate transporter protein
MARPDTTPAVPAAADGIADPAPLGLAAFAATTFVLSCFNAHLINASEEQVVLPLALFYGGLMQVLASMWEFRKGNTFGATAFGSYGAFWLSFAALVRFAKLPPDHAYQALGLYLLIWSIFTFYMTIAALRTTVALLAVFAVLTATFVVLTVGNFAQSTGTLKVGGWLGLVTAVLAWYASFAGVVNATWKQQVIPVLPLPGPGA